MSDTQRDREERQHVIEVLKSWDGYFIGYTSDEVQEALRYAISSIETDLKYDLLYEETSGQADKQADKPTTKNDLGVDAISRKAVQTRLKEIINEMETIFADIREREVNDSVCGLCEYDCDHGLDGFANECPGFEKDDCFKLNEKYRAEWLDISNLPSVTPQEPRSFKWCTDCKEYDQEKHCCHRYSKVIRDTVEEMKQEPRWIPVSERLPKIADVYRVTRYYRDNAMNLKYFVDACFFDGSNTWYNDNRINHERGYVTNIIAWQENPEPYEPQKVSSSGKSRSNLSVS